MLRYGIQLSAVVALVHIASSAITPGSAAITTAVTLRRASEACGLLNDTREAVIVAACSSGHLGTLHQVDQDRGLRGIRIDSTIACWGNDGDGHASPPS